MSSDIVSESSSTSTSATDTLAATTAKKLSQELAAQIRATPRSKNGGWRQQDHIDALVLLQEERRVECKSVVLNSPSRVVFKGDGK